VAQNNRVWSTYYGGTADDYVNAVKTDLNGNIYICGSASSLSGIASGGFQNTYGGGASDAFVAKFNMSGQRIWATYIGGTDNEEAMALALDSTGNIYVCGDTKSLASIASGGFQNTFGGNSDAFLIKLDPQGNRVWSTYYGGIDADYGYDVCTDAAGRIYMSGITSGSPGAIASGGFQNTYGGAADDAFLVKFDPAGNRLWGTYYGGPLVDYGNGVSTDPAGNVFLSGATESSTGIASGGSQNSYGGGFDDAFLVKFDSLGSRIWSTYFGGTGFDYGYHTATDRNGNVYLAGLTSSAFGISFGGFQPTYGGGSYDAFIVKYDAGGTLKWSSYYGGGGDDEAFALTTSANGDVYLSGTTKSNSGIASGGFQDSLKGATDFFLSRFDANGQRKCATYFGKGHESGSSICVQDADNVYLAGITTDTVGIASGGFQNSSGGSSDGLLVHMTGCCADVAPPAVSNHQTIYAGQTTMLDAGTGYTSYSWNPGGQTSQSISVNPAVTSTYTLTVTSGVGCSSTFIVEVEVLQRKIIVPNIITPNGDGSNDSFIVQDLDFFPNSKLQIFDRWGKLVYNAAPYTNDWDGGNHSNGTYYYLLSFPDGRIYKGFLELLK
jgi:gliding motility-associated-like protein